MSLPIVYRRRVQSDLAAAYDWYEERSPGLGEMLISSVASVFKGIEEFPEMFVLVHRSIRRATLSRFPFAVFYFVETSALFFSECSTRRATRGSGPVPGNSED